MMHTCSGCHYTFGHKQLCVQKFVIDANLCINDNVPMPGTILEPNIGRTIILRDTKQIAFQRRSFPNRMIQKVLVTELPELLKSEGDTIQSVQKMIEEILKKSINLKLIDDVSGNPRRRVYNTDRMSRVMVRRMMSRYSDNHEMFSLDLNSAIMRQGVFVDKMVKLDWLHSPNATGTMTSLITKYGRFINIMVTNPGKVVVPTLDVDLAWHTHQLSCKGYYDYTVKRTGRFVDHDDKIDENKLNDAFEWTTKKYQALYKEVYSACTCWYCESK